MENRNNQTITETGYNFEFANNVGNGNDLDTRLNGFLAAYSQNGAENSILKNEQEVFEAGLLKNPLPTQQVYSQFGLMLGAFPPMAFFIKFLMNAHLSPNENWIPVLLIFVNAVCATVGYFSGKLIGTIVEQTEKMSWGLMLAILPFIGIFWGIMAGGAGGLFIFVIGAFFGAIIASAVGAVALPIFTIFHRNMKKGEVMERDQFLPIAMGITLIISALILGATFK